MAARRDGMCVAFMRVTQDGRARGRDPSPGPTADVRPVSVPLGLARRARSSGDPASGINPGEP